MFFLLFFYSDELNLMLSEILQSLKFTEFCRSLSEGENRQCAGQVGLVMGRSLEVDPCMRLSMWVCTST
jgi:hypothetical protein